MQGQEGDGRVDGLATLGTQSHHLQPGLVDLLSKLIDGDVGRRAHEHGRPGLLHQVVDDGGRRDGLTGTRRAL